MEEILGYIAGNIELAPYLIFGLLLLAGLCIPIPEDGMLLTSGILASLHPDNAIPLFIGVYAGAYFSDLIAYWMGRRFGPGLWKIKLVEKTISMDKIHLMHQYFEKYGVITLIFGRFVPFGFRNAMFISAGLSRMNFIKFAAADLLACTISTLFFFNLYYHLGRPVIEYVKQSNYIIGALVLIVILAIYISKRRSK
ncbi:MAG: DedA family protein [Bacteriovoracaceae bacterium]|nr:DedA family protein [Bacteriovoracaceae bacterium]